MNFLMKRAVKRTWIGQKYPREAAGCKTACIIAFMFLIVPFFFSCDILRLSPFAVSDWGPGGGYRNEPEKIVIFLDFSHEPNRASVEKNFSLSDDAGQVRGAFRWKGKKMIFTCAVPLEINRDYVIHLAADACDEKGLSLDSSFEGRFTTRRNHTRPSVLSCFPEMDSVINDLRSPVRLYFSRAVSLVSLQNNVSISPHINGAWHLHDTTAIFTPAEPWSYRTRYEIRAADSLVGDNGRSMGNAFLSVFTTGSDHSSPLLSGAWRVTKNEAGETDEVPLLEEEANTVFRENRGWENGDKLRLDFSKKVDSTSVKNCLSVEGAAFVALESAPSFSDTFVFSFEKNPVYESRFSLSVKAGIKDVFGNASEDEHVFRFYANGIRSKPPALAGIRLPLAPGSGGDPETVSFGIDSLFEDLPINDGVTRYPFSTETATWIECYFETSPGVSIDTFSLMEKFKITTSNNVLVFSPRKISADVFSLPAPDPKWEGCVRIEIRGMLTNTVNSGIVNVEIAPGLTDSAGNTSEKVFRISLLK